jgi:hypothetical protein
MQSGRVGGARCLGPELAVKHDLKHEELFERRHGLASRWGAGYMH